MKTLLPILIFTMLIGCKYDEPSEHLTQFDKTYGGISEDVGMDAILVRNHLFVTGKVSTGGSADILLMKLDLDGNEVWQRSIGGAGFQSGTRLFCNDANELLIVGHGVSDGGSDNDLILVKTDSDGNVIWQSSVPSENGDLGMGVIQVEGGYIVCGGDLDTNRDMLIAKFSEAGNLLWTKAYGGPMNDAAWKVLKKDNGNLLFYGFTESFGAGSSDIWLLETNSAGDSLSSTTLGTSAYETSGSIIQTDDGGFLTCNHSAATEPNHELHVAKLDAGFNLIWEHHSGYSNGHDGGEDIAIDNGVIYAAGRSAGTNGQSDDGYLVKLNLSGVAISDTLIGGALNDRFNSVVVSETSVYLIGSTNSNGEGDDDIWVVKTPK